MQYKIPSQFSFRIHHVRPRFKSDIESVLLYMATEIAKLPEQSSRDFSNALNNAVKLYTGNAVKTEKTINNWRTEISALFGFYIEQDNGNTKAGLRAIELSENQDLVEMFKKFLFTFQYPASHIKAKDIKEQIEAGIRFKPAQYFLKVLQHAEQSTGNREFITREEACHCILNDLRCSRDNENPATVWNRIITNRNAKMTYDSSGDVIRYAGDILDYMEIANLLVSHGNKFYINNLENETILKFINSNLWFNGFDNMISQRTATLPLINQQKENWFNFANSKLSETDFATDILAFISDNAQELASIKAELEKANIEAFDKSVSRDIALKTKDIGDMGESLVHSHECERVKRGGRADLIHLIKRIPTQLAVGYDIQSVELDAKKRLIEVKTTISSKPLDFNKIHLTPNEWSSADTYGERYFVYRLVLNKYEKKLFIIQDPVGLYKKGFVSIALRNGADISFGNNAGKEEELLAWAN